MDHWSLTPLLGDIMSAYHGQEPEKRAPFKDFVDYCGKLDESSAKAFWQSRFKGSPAIFPRIQPGHVPKATLKTTRRCTLSQVGDKVSLAQVPAYIEASWALTASTYSGSDSIAFGLVLSGRSAAMLKGIETTLGPTIATVPLQVNLRRSMTVEALLKDRTASLRQLQASPALQYGLSRICDVGEAAKSAAGFQTLLNIRSWTEHQESGELTYDYSEEPHGGFALVLSCNFTNDGILVEASCDPAIVCETQLHRILQQFEHILRSMMEADTQTKLEQLPLLNSADKSEILNWNKSVPSPADRCVHDFFIDQVREAPDAAAVVASDGNATYFELDQMSNRLAHELRRRGVSRGTYVAFIFGKSLWTVVSVLAIVKAGGACVPIEMADPRDRQASIIDSADAKMILCSIEARKEVTDLAADVLAVDGDSISALPDETGPILHDKPSARDLAYVIFTSGSTGTPKGAMLEHRGLVSSLGAVRDRVGWRKGIRVLQFAAHVWDVSIGEILGSLMFGACICIPSDETRRSNLTAFMKSARVDLAWLTPTVLRTMSPSEVPSLKTLLSVGEPVSPEAGKTWGAALQLFNGWGPCETSVLSAIARLTPDSPFPETIGRPLGCSIWLASPSNINILVPIGAVGEILIEGPGVARSYLNDKAKSAAAFVLPPSWAPKRDGESSCFYRTGDLARYNPDGSIGFVGRQDNQVKIRGQRFELGELESVLERCREVRSVFAVSKISAGRTELVAIVCLGDHRLPAEAALKEIPESHAELASERLREVRDYARSKLPSFMVPTVWIAVEQMPSTRSEKVDRTAIRDWLKKKDIAPAKAVLDAHISLSLTAPASEEELFLQSVWSDVLKVPKESIGLESSFIQLGGESILAMQVSSRCRNGGYQPTTAALLTPNKDLASIARSMAETGAQTRNLASSLAKPDRDVQDTLAEYDSRLSQLSRSNERIRPDNIECVSPATDSQAAMIAIGEVGSARGYYIDFILDFKPVLNLARLRDACNSVVQHHQILRTVFVQHGSDLFQVVLKDLPSAVVRTNTSDEDVVRFSEENTLAMFHLFSEENSCHRLRLEIHHALYDALSLGIIFRDLNAAYTNKKLSSGPQFGSWTSFVRQLDKGASNEFWANTLRGSSVSAIVPSVEGSMKGYALEDSIKLSVPLSTMQTSRGTPSSVLKAAWSLVNAIALDSRDVVFGEVSNNRYVNFPGVEDVCGPCVNNVPVRARIEEGMTLSSLVKQIQDQSTASMPHHHIGIRTIIQSCTEWPSWTRFSSALVYQNHGALGSYIRIGDADGELSNQGKLGDSADIWIIASPGVSDLEIEVRFASQSLPREHAEWLSRSLQTILEAVPLSLDASIDELKSSVWQVVGQYTILDRASDRLQHQSNGDMEVASSDAQSAVARAWGEMGLLPAGPSKDYSECTMFERGGDVVTALLLSQYYRRSGYEVSVDDMLRNPVQSMQGHLLDWRAKELQSGVNGVCK